MKLRLLNKLKDWWYEKSIDRLLKEAGVDLSPEPDIWGILPKFEEDLVLAQLWSNKLWISLMRKYAEGANKAMIQAVKAKNYDEALRLNGQFFCYNSMLIKARRAAQKEPQKNDTRASQS